jgi:tellurite resistance protein TehA-like permease
VAAELSSPRTCFGFFAFVAAAAVLGARLSELRQPDLALVLFAVAALSWLLLTYVVPARLILLKQKGVQAEIVRGDWLLWVVGTQSIATIGAMVAAHSQALRSGMTVVAVLAWSVGIVLYLILITLITVRLFTIRVDAAGLSASYWISMGATAISTLAGARILGLPHDLPILQLGIPIVGGVSLVLWSFGTWWIPLLLVLGLWRHWYAGHSIAYDREFWSIVFPLGMYATASAEFGAVAKLQFMVELGRWVFWLALLAWFAVSIGLLISIGLSLRRPDWRR